MTTASDALAGHAEIALTTEVQHRQLTIRVADNGVGMDQVTLPRVFELFAQGDHAWRLGSGGLGVGLTLARRLVEMHGGTLEAESAGPGLGRRSSSGCPCPNRGPNGRCKRRNTR